MFGTTGRFSIEFQFGVNTPFEKHQFLNTDSEKLAAFGFQEAKQGVKRINGCDTSAIRLFDNETGQTIKEWQAA